MDIIDLYSKAFINDPYPAYQQIHDLGGIYQCPEHGFYYIASHARVKQFFKHPAMSSDRISKLSKDLPDPVKQFADPLISSLSKWILFQDPPFHTQVRKIINPAFSATTIRAITPRIQTVTKTLLQHCESEFDIINALAYPLPVTIISELLAVPHSDHEKIRRWSDAIAQFLGEKTDLAQLAQIQQCLVEASEYFTTIVNHQRTHCTSTLLAQLFKLQQQEPEFTDEHLVANFIALIFAGHETTTNAIANTLLSLILHPDTMKSRRASQQQLDDITEESLRWQSPVQRMGRLIVEDVPTETITLEKGRRIFLLMGAANRDPELFSEPERFDPQRHNAANHFAFGYGPHFCSGAQLARTEIKVVAAEFIAQYDLKKFKIEAMSWRHNLALRGPLPFKVSYQG